MESKALETQVVKIREAIEKQALVSRKQTMFPTKPLMFKESPVKLKKATMGTDGHFYGFNENGVLGKYTSLVNDGEPVETGFTWAEGTYGILMQMFVVDDGFVFFTNAWKDPNRITRVLRSENITDTPEVVYEPVDTSFITLWSEHFGITHYYNGESYFLAGCYGSGQEYRELILSTDGGRTFKVVKHTSNLSTNTNSHWHDTEIDYHRGLLWASEGDGVENDHIFYSDDLGETWNTLSDNEQPTSITTYPNRMIFGRDGKNVGLDTIEMPAMISDLTPELFQPYREFNKQSAAFFFAMKPIVYKNESYMNFLLYNDSKVPIIVASGDFGESWHGVYMGVKQKEMSNFFAIDDTYVYALKVDGSGVLYSEKPEWV